MKSSNGGNRIACLAYHWPSGFIICLQNDFKTIWRTGLSFMNPIPPAGRSTTYYSQTRKQVIQLMESCWGPSTVHVKLRNNAASRHIVMMWWNCTKPMIFSNKWGTPGWDSHPSVFNETEIEKVVTTGPLSPAPLCRWPLPPPCLRPLPLQQPMSGVVKHMFITYMDVYCT